MEIENYDLNDKWILWFHKVNDNNWDLSSYEKIYEISTYYDILFIIKEISNITSGMFFFMKNGINPVYEDNKNKNGGYWSFRITKKDSFELWEKIIFYLTIDKITNENNDLINGFSVSPKINNCIFKIWNSDYYKMKIEDLRKDLDFVKYDEIFYLQHSEN